MQMESTPSVLKASRNIVRSVKDLSPLFRAFVSFFLFHKGVIPAPLEQILSTCTDLKPRKFAKLEKWYNSLQNALSSACSYISQHRDTLESIELSVLLGPSVLCPKDICRLKLLCIDSSMDGPSEYPDEDAYMTKLVKALIRELLANSEHFQSSDSMVHKAVHLVFAFRFKSSSDLNQSLSSMTVNEEETNDFSEESDMEIVDRSHFECDFLQYFIYRKQFRPKVRRNKMIYQVLIQYENPENCTVCENLDNNHEELTQFFSLKKALKYSIV